ncbi:DUF4336 domain-containing protein [Mesorhizobium sp. B3-1-3]|nr:DUF4336 domain-containing protein [Mesorhizobium sp. B3-1-8]TPI70467.1 DUF4336 domain-containing protein [Mesorhizobium sp. B3-1-3]
MDLYETINVLKPVAPDLWIVDGSEIRFGLGWLKFPFSTRMTIVRLRSGELVLHSPVAYSPALRSAIEILGPIRYLVAPNSLRYWWVPDWKAVVPAAKILAVRGLSRRAKRRIDVDTMLVGRHSPWPDDVDLLVVRGRYADGGRTVSPQHPNVILTDLIENFEPSRFHSRLLGLLVKLAGAADPDGKAPIDMRLSFFGRRTALRLAVCQMLDWDPERVIVSHGRWYEKDGASELRRAFRWAL